MKYFFLICFLVWNAYAAFSQSVTIFGKNMNGYVCYRIPALITTQKGSVLAFAEARKKSCSDTGDIDLVLRRSTDGGKTWGPLMVIRDNGSNVSGNPVPIVDASTGRIVLIFCGNRGEDTESEIIAGTAKDGRRVYVMFSVTDGLSWSEPREITSSVKKDDWTWYATGPCHGIRLQSEKYKNRLVVPSNHVKSGTNHHFSQMLYSDDGGETWQLGESTRTPNGNESTVTELPDGSLLLNMRNMNQHEKHRLQALSSDGGNSVGEIRHVPELMEPVCQGSIINYPKRGNISDTLLFSNPHDVVRKNMSIQISRDGGNTWKKAVTVFEGHSAYSDMTVFANGDVGIIYENGAENAYDRISFQRVSRKKFK